ncbi:MAG: hypothetical protein AB3X41_08650 [Leptothrix ochracea]|uniref:hypothetical protein n=1 Tax=Leptothrix ochracea TaxID=735331 RepID=UPI0034E28364
MNKQLSILACLLLPFAAAQAQQAPTAPTTPTSTVAPNHVTATAKSQQTRHAKDAACQKAARDKGLRDQAFKEDVMACMK